MVQGPDGAVQRPVYPGALVCGHPAILDEGKVAAILTVENSACLDAGIEVIAVVSDSLPIHNDDYYHDDQVRESNKGWSKAERIRNGYRVCSLPYSLFMIDGSTK